MSDVRERDVELALEEILGGATPPDLSARIMASLDDAADDDHESAASHAPAGRSDLSSFRQRFGTWASAACLILGLGMMVWSYFYEQPVTIPGDGEGQRPLRAGVNPVKPELLPNTFTASSIDELRKLPTNIARLVCHDIGDDDTVLLTRFTWLEELSLRDCDAITDRAAPHIASLRYLTKLDLYGCDEITDRAFNDLSTLTRLDTLDIAFSKTTDAGVARIAQSFNLVRFDLCSCDNIDDGALKHLVNQTWLETLNMWDCTKITLDGLRALVDLPALRELGLRGCTGISDADAGQLAKLAPHWTIAR